MFVILFLRKYSLCLFSSRDASVISVCFVRLVIDADFKGEIYIGCAFEQPPGQEREDLIDDDGLMVTC